MISGIYKYPPTSSLIFFASTTFCVLSTLEISNFSGSGSELELGTELLEEEIDEDELDETEELSKTEDISLELLVSPLEQADSEKITEAAAKMFKNFFLMSHYPLGGDF